MDVLFLILGALFALIVAAALWARIEDRSDKRDSTVEVTPERLAASKRVFDEKRAEETLVDPKQD